jgi:hypothetical protein
MIRHIKDIALSMTAERSIPLNDGQPWSNNRMRHRVALVKRFYTYIGFSSYNRLHEVKVNHCCLEYSSLNPDVSAAQSSSPQAS